MEDILRLSPKLWLVVGVSWLSFSNGTEPLHILRHEGVNEGTKVHALPLKTVAAPGGQDVRCVTKDGSLLDMIPRHIYRALVCTNAHLITWKSDYELNFLHRKANEMNTALKDARLPG